MHRLHVLFVFGFLFAAGNFAHAIPACKKELVLKLDPIIRRMCLNAPITGQNVVTMFDENGELCGYRCGTEPGTPLSDLPLPTPK